MRRAWRPLALALVLTGTLAFIEPGRGQAAEDGEPTARKSPTRTELVGSASARVAAAGPIVGGLNLEAGFARSTVELSGDAARGESATMSAGAASLFLSLAGAPPVVPEPTRADSNGPADAERSVAAPAGDFVRVGHEKAHAQPRRSDAVTRLGDLNVGDAAAIVGGASTAGINEEGSRSSSAVGELRLGGAGGPAVVLSGLAWRAEQRRDAPAEAGFSIGAASVGGQPLAVGSPEQIAAAIDAINGVLASQGIRIQAPVVMAGADGARVDPLRIELRDPPVNRAVAGAVYSPLAPTVSQTQEAVVGAGGSDPRLSQALLAANVALSLLLGNGGAGVEVGGAMAGLTTREVPDLGSLFGNSPPPPLPDGPLGDDDGAIGASGGGLDGTDAPPAGPADIAGGLFDGGPGSAAYGAVPVSDAGSGVLPGGSAPAAAPPTTDVALGTGDARGRSQPADRGRLPAPLAAAALATGLAIAGVDWLARRRTVGVVGGLRAAAGLGVAVGRPGRSRRSFLAAAVAAVTVLALALAPSRVPLPSRVSDEVAAVSPVPPPEDGGPAPAGGPVDDEAAAAGRSAVAVPGVNSASSTATPGVSGAPGSGSGGGRVNAGPNANRRNPSLNRPGSSGPTGGTGPAGRTDTTAAAAPGAVIRGRDWPRW
ncbi:MAG: hypothetical protein AB1679_32620 [Actinomycetota bacterium]